MATSPFDVGPFDAVNRRRAQGSAFPDAGYVPEDTQAQAAPDAQNTPLVADEQSDAAVEQQRQAQRQKQDQLDQVAAQKAQDAQAKTDQANWQDQARVGAANAKQAGIVTKESAIPGPDGKDINVQGYTQNPDGTTAYEPKDLGVQTLADGAAYRVKRNQWGAQEYSDPFQAGTNANANLNANGQIMATPKGKDAADLPKKDVTLQGVSGDTTGNPADLKVAPNAAINQPTIQGSLNSQEQALVKSAAAQHVKDTLGDSAANAKDDYDKATADHTAAAANVVAAAAAARNSDDDSSQDDLTKARSALQAAQATLDQTHKAHADAAAAFKIASNNPLAYLQAQPPGDGSPDPNDPWHQVSEKTGIPYGKLVNSVGTSMQAAQITGQANDTFGDLSNAIASEKVVGPGQTQPSNPPAVPNSPTDPSQPGTPAPTNPNPTTGSTAGQDGQQPGDQPQPLAQKGTWGSWLKNAGAAALGGFEGSIGNVMKGFGAGMNLMDPGKSLGLNQLLAPIAKSMMAPANFQRWSQQVNAPNLVTSAGDQIKANANALSSGTALKLPDLGPLGTGKTLQVDPNRTGTGLVGGAAAMVPMAAGGEAEIPLWMNEGYQNAVDTSKAAGEPGYVSQAKGVVGAVTMGGAAKLFSAFGGLPSKFNPALWGTRAAADGTTSPLLKVLQNGATATTSNLLARAAQFAGKGAIEGAGFSVGGQVAAGDNPYRPADADKNTSEDLSSAGSLAGIQALLGTIFHGRSLFQISKGVDEIVDQVNKERTDAAPGQEPQPPVDRTTVIANLIQHNQALRAQDSFDGLQKQYSKIDGNDALTPGQRLGLKMRAVSALPLALRPAIIAHLDASTESQRQVDEAMKAADAEQAKIPAANPDLARRSDAYIQANAQDITNSRQTAQPRQRQLIGNETEDSIMAEADRRQQISELSQQRQQVVAGIAAKLKDSLDQTVAMSKTPEGRSALLSLNRYNASQPVDAPKASATTLQSALDLGPNPTGDVKLPAVYVEHYLPLAHQIEQLPDPDQQAMATAAIKLTNGRALTPDEQRLMLGDPTTGQPGAVDVTTGKPLAMVANGKPVLTNAGLSRLKTLVPAASDVLPRNEQAQLEAQPPPLPAVSRKPDGPAANRATTPADSGGPSPATAGNALQPDPALAHVSTENLQNQITGMQAAMAKTRESGGTMPPSAHSQLARFHQEVAARSRQSVVADDAALGAPAGHKVDETIAFTHPGPDGRPVQARGDITEVHPNYYRIATEDGMEHRVPIIEKGAPVVSKGKQVQANRALAEYRSGKADDKLTQKRLRNVGLSDEEVQKRLAPPASEKGSETEPAKPKATVPKFKAGDLPGVDVLTIKPEQAEAATLLSSTYAKVRGTAQALGISGFKTASHPKGQIGLAVHPADLSKIELDLPRLAQELAKLPTPASRQARIEDVMDEELRHVALETVAGENDGTHSPAQADATFARLWSSASPFQKQTAIDLYDKGALAFVDPESAAKSSHGTLENASDANKGREYLRMLSQLQARGRTSEIADLLTPETKPFFQKVVDYLRHVFTRVNDPAAKQLLDRTEELLQMHRHVDDDQLDMSHPDGRPSANETGHNIADIALPSGETIPARYELAELADIQASHRNGAPNPQYPLGLNERDYSLPEEKAKNEGMVSGFDPRRVVTDNPDATNGPPIVDKSGIVLGGNRRAIMLSDPRAYAKYKPYLQQNADRFGLNPDDVAKMHQPVLIRRVDTPEAQRPELIRRLNEVPTGGIDTANDAVSAGKQITPDLVKSVSDLFQQDPDKTPLQHLTDGDTKSIAQGLLDAGAIRPNDKEKYVTSNGNLSPEGARFARSVLSGGILPDPQLLREINDTPTQTKLLNGLSPIYTMKARGVDIAPLQEAVGLEADRHRLGIKNVVDHQSQGNLSGIGKEPTTEGKTIQSFLAGIKGNEARRAFTQLQTLAAPLEPGQTGLFGESNRKSLADVTDAEINKVLASAKKITKQADALKKAMPIGGAGVRDTSYPGPLKMVGMPGLDPEQQRVEAKFADWVQRDPDRAARAYAALPESEGGRVLDMDEARKLSPDYNASRHAKTLHSVSVQKVVNALTVQKLVPDALVNLRPGDTMGLTAGGPGSGKGNIRRILPGEWNGAKFVYDGVLRNFSDAVNNVEDAKAKGAKATIWYVHVPVEKAVDNAVGRAEHDGRALPLSVLATGHFQAQQTIIKLLRHYAHDPAVTIRVVDNSGSHAQVINDPLSYLQNERTLYQDADEVETRARAAFEAQANQLTDPAAVSIFRTGSVGPGLSEAGRPTRPASLGEREPGVGQGDVAATPGATGPNAVEHSGSARGSAGDRSDEQQPPSSSFPATGVPGTDGSGTSRPGVANPLAAVPLENVRRIRDTLAKAQANGQPLTESQKKLLAFARARLDGTVGGSAIRDTGTGSLFDQPAVEPERQTRADEVPLTRTQALNVYRNLSPRRQAGEALNVQASRLLERAEQTLGQTFIPGMDDTASSRTATRTPPPTVNFGKPETGIRAELRTEGPDMFGAKPPGQQSLFGSGVRDLPMDLPGQRDLGLSGDSMARRPGSTLPRRVEAPLRRYLSALHQSDLNMGLPGQRPLDFSRQYQTDFGTAPSRELTTGAREIQKADGIETTPQERFEGNLDLADRIAARFRNTPGTSMDDLQQVARLALHKASERFNPADGVPFRALAARYIRNALIDLQRRQKRQGLEQPTLDAPHPGTDTTAKDNVPSVEPLASQSVAQAESHSLLRSEIGKLPDAVRHVAEGLLAGKSQANIAQERGYSSQRANYLAAAALTKLKQAFEDQGIGKRDLIGGAAVAGLPEKAVPAARTKAAQLWAEKGVQSPFFIRWFGESKMVDNDGKPQVYYHGSKASGLTEFNLDKQVARRRGVDRGPAGFYFGDRDIAENFAHDNKQFPPAPHPENVHAVYLKIEHPFTNREKLTGNLWSDFTKAFPESEASPLAKMDFAQVAEGLKDGWANGATLNNVFEHLNRDAPSGSEPTFEKSIDLRKRYTAFLKAHGFDGFNFGDGTGVVAFDPEQIKSADKNSGRFNPGDPRMVAAAGVRPPLNFDLEGQSFADGKDAFDKNDVDTWPITEEDRERLRQFSGDPGDNDEYTSLAGLADQMKEQGWPEPIVAKAAELRDEMAKHFEAGADELNDRASEVENYLHNPDRQVAHDTDLDDTDTWPEAIKDQWDNLDLSDSTTWPAGMEADAGRDGAITETPVDEDESNGETQKEIDQDYAQAWMADHLVAPEVRRAIDALPEGSDIDANRTRAVLDHMARTEAERRLESSPEKKALEQATQDRDGFARSAAERRGLKGYAPYINDRKLRIHDGDWQDHELTPEEGGQAAELHRRYLQAYRSHDAAVDRETNEIRPQMDAHPTARWDDSRVADWKRDNTPEGGPERPAETQGTLFGTGVSDAEKQRNLAKYALGFEPFAKHDVVPAMRTMRDSIKTSGDVALKLFAPQFRGEAAARTARSLSTHLAEAAHEWDQAVDLTKKAHQVFDAMPAAKNHAFMDAVENNRPQADDRLEDIRKLLSSINHRHVEVARSMPQQHFGAYVRYFVPHIWNSSDLGGMRDRFAEVLRQKLDPGSAAGSARLELHPATQEPVLRLGNRLQPLDGADARWAKDLMGSKNGLDAIERFYQRKIEGSRAFLKHRVIPTIEEGRALGLNLVSNNPVDLYLARWKQMNKYIAGQRMIDEMKQQGIARHFDDPNDVPPGWKRVDDRLGLSTEQYTDENGKIRFRNRSLYAPAEAVDVLDNYLSPGLRNSKNEVLSGGYKIINGAANVLNQAQLGFSAFHAGFTTVDTMVSKLALAIRQAEQGQLADAAKSVGSVVTLTAPITNFIRGSKLLREWYAPGTQGEEMRKMLDFAIKGGARSRMDAMYSDHWIKSAGKAWRQGNYPGFVMRLPFAALETIMKPIMEDLVPRQKLGVFADLARFEMKRLGPNATEDQLREAAQRAWASVDNRLGQLVYDNLHWNKTVKDLAMITTRSVGWNLGTLREIGGGAVDAAKFLGNAVTGKKAEFTHRMAYVLALHALLAGMGTLTGYLLTGRRPESLTDIYFPKTGEKDANGHDVRLSFPSYVKDEAAYLHAPGTTTENKLNPLWSSVLQVIENKDYYGNQIYGPDDHLPTQALDVGKFAGKQLTPFSLAGGNQFSKDVAPGDNVGPLRQLVGSKFVHEALSAGPTVGVTPAAKYLSTSPAEQRAQELESRLYAGESRTQADYEKSQAKAALRTLIAQSNDDGKVVGPAIRDAIQAGTIKRGDVGKLRDDAKLSSLERMARDITSEYERKGQSAEGYQALRTVWDKANPKEQRTLVRYIMPLYNKVAKLPGSNPGPRPAVKVSPQSSSARPADLTMAQ